MLQIKTQKKNEKKHENVMHKIGIKKKYSLVSVWLTEKWAKMHYL